MKKRLRQPLLQKSAPVVAAAVSAAFALGARRAAGTAAATGLTLLVYCLLNNMPRRICTSLSLFTALLCAATLLLWISSYFWTWHLGRARIEIKDGSVFEYHSGLFSSRGEVSAGIESCNAREDLYRQHIAAELPVPINQFGSRFGSSIPAPCERDDWFAFGFGSNGGYEPAAAWGQEQYVVYSIGHWYICLSLAVIAAFLWQARRSSTWIYAAVAAAALLVAFGWFGVISNGGIILLGMYGLPFLAILVYATFALWSWFFRRDGPPGFCPTCGYDLRASPERCPECGTASPKGAI